MKALGIWLIVIAVALGATGMLLARRSVFYSASAVVKVARDKVDLPELTGFANLAAGAGGAADNAFFIETEIAVVRSDAPLSQVIAQLKLNEVWGHRLNRGNALNASESSQLLRERLHPQPGSEPGLIQINAFSDVATEAADIANAVALAYCEYRTDYRRRLTQAALDAVAGKFADMEKQIADSQAKVEQAWQQLDPALRELAATNASTTGSEVLRHLHYRFSESLLRYLTASNQLALFATNVAAPEIMKQLKERADKARAEMTAAEKATSSEMHRIDLLKSYQAAQLELEELNQRFAPIREKVEGLRNDLRPQSHLPASVVEPATVPSAPDAGSASRQPWLLPTAGVTLLLGVALLTMGRNPKKTAA